MLEIWALEKAVLSGFSSTDTVANAKVLFTFYRSVPVGEVFVISFLVYSATKWEEYFHKILSHTDCGN